MPIISDPIAEPPPAIKEAAILSTACRAADSHWDIAFDIATHAEAAITLLAWGAAPVEVAELLRVAVSDYKARRKALIDRVMADMADAMKR